MWSLATTINHQLAGIKKTTESVRIFTFVELISTCSESHTKSLGDLRAFNHTPYFHLYTHP